MNNRKSHSESVNMDAEFSVLPQSLPVRMKFGK